MKGEIFIKKNIIFIIILIMTLITGCSQNNYKEEHINISETDIVINDIANKIFYNMSSYIEIPFSYVEDNCKYDVCTIYLPTNMNILGYKNPYGFEHWIDSEYKWFEHYPKTISELLDSKESLDFKELCIADNKGIGDSDNYIFIEITETPFLSYGFVGEYESTLTQRNGYNIRYADTGKFQIELPNNKYLDISVITPNTYSWEDIFDLITFNNFETESLININNDSTVEECLEMLYHEEFENIIDFTMFENVLDFKVPKNSIYTIDENSILYCKGKFGKLEVKIDNEKRYHSSYPHIENSEYIVTYEVPQDYEEYIIVRIWLIDDINNLDDWQDYIEICYSGDLLNKTDSETIATILSKCLVFLI